MGAVLTTGNQHMVFANLHLTTQQLEQIAAILNISRNELMLYSGAQIHFYLSPRPVPRGGDAPSSSPGGGFPANAAGRRQTLTQMHGGSVPASVKRTSALRRVPSLEALRFRPGPGGEGDVCVFELPRDAVPITVESSTGRIMAIAPGDTFLATPGYREARRWAVGSIPAGGLARTIGCSPIPAWLAN